jgi:hypothetical protein
VGGCFGDDDDDGGGAKATSRDPCSETHPVEMKVPDVYKDSVRLCSRGGGTSVRADNISNLVVVVESDSQDVAPHDITAPPSSFTASVVRQFAPVECGIGSCRLPPKSSLQLDGWKPIRVRLRVAPVDTVSSWATRTFVTTKIGQKLTPRPRRNAERVASCLTGGQAALEARHWEESVRSALETAPGCQSLIKEFVGSTPKEQKTFTRRFIVRTRAYAGEFAPELLLGAVRVVRALR